MAIDTFLLLLLLVAVAILIFRQLQLRGASNGDAEALADHFCGAIVGIVYQWLVQPEARARIAAMHETLKLTMRERLPAPRDLPEETNR